jgi:hypothetical protein
MTRDKQALEYGNVHAMNYDREISMYIVRTESFRLKKLIEVKVIEVEVIEQENAKQ